jgi:transposase
MNYIGIDLGKVHLQICEISESGELWEKRIATERSRITEVMGGRPAARILLEAGTESEWVARLLEEIGHDVIVADPNYAPMYGHRQRRIKTDRRDALALAEACRLGLYRRAHRTSDARRHVRALLSVRDGLVRTRTRWIIVIRSILRRDGLRVRSGNAETFAARVAELTLPEEVRREIEPLLKCLRPVNRQLADLDRHLKHLATQDQAAKRLTTVPGVGPVTALGFVATIDRVDRFKSGHQVASYLGLVPREWSSSESQHRGRITKTGNHRTRWLLGQAAQSLLRLTRRPETQRLREWTEQIAGRRGRGVAVVALSRRLAGILFAMWRDGTVYDARHLTPRGLAHPAV